jgi:hypothetical protein
VGSWFGCAVGFKVGTMRARPEAGLCVAAR